MGTWLRPLALMTWLFLAGSSASGEPPSRRSFTLADHAPPANAAIDAGPAFRRLFAAVATAKGGIVVIPPGDYALGSSAPVELSSQTHVVATGARFLLPERLGAEARVVLFQGENLREFSWTGGTFLGHGFDPTHGDNVWEPSTSTRPIVVTTTADGTTADLLFRDIHSEEIAGAVITVLGFPRPGSESEVQTYATRVTLENCSLLDSGKFMWDYGYLWQVTLWPEDHSEVERAHASRYFPAELIRDGLTLADGDDRVRLENGERPIPIARTDTPRDAICFFGDTLPRNLTRGRQVFVVESTPDHIKVSDRPGGPPVRFEGGAGPKARLARDHQRAFLSLYQPIGAGPGKGAIDLIGCKDVRVSGCKLSARGDAMHIQRCRDVVFTGNQILGARMGAFFLAEYCQNATITGNTVDGTNGSRVMSVEKSCTDVTITGNTFRNGGRGSWINQPTRFVLQGNVFVDNTTKGERNPRRGRRTFLTGDYEVYPELYFTLHQPEGTYGPVIVADNIFATGPACGPAITFARNGHDIVVRHNVFQGPGQAIRVDPSCAGVVVGDNHGSP